MHQALEEEIVRIEALESPRRRRKGVTQLEASFNLSLNALRADDEEAYQAFIWLGVLSEDMPITAPVTATLWDFPKAEATDILELLWNDALLRLDASLMIEEISWSTYQLHDMLREVARRLLIAPEPEGLGLDLSTAHAKFLQNYHRHCHNKQWHTLPHDGYIQTRLSWHMEKAKQAHQIHNLLNEETANSQNGWYQMCEHTGHMASFLKDVTKAWHLADTAYTKGQISEAIGHQCRYALIKASLNSLAKNIPPALLFALVQKEVWTPDQGLAYARQIPDTQQRIDALLQLVSYLPESIQDDTLKKILLDVQNLLDGANQVDTLGKLFPILAQTGHLKEALDAVQSILSGPNRATTLVALIPYLSPPYLLEEALSIATTIKPVSEQTKALVGLIPYLPGSLLRQVFDIALTISPGRERANILVALIPYMPESDLEDILTATEAIEQSTERARVLASLAFYLSEPLLDQALAMVEQIERSADQVLALTGIFPRLAALGYPDEALIIINRLYIPEEQDIVFLGSQDRLLAGRTSDHLYTAKDQDTILLVLVPQLVALDYLNEALQAAQAINDHQQRSKTLADLVGHFAGVIIPEQVTAIALEIEYNYHKARALLNLAPHLSGPAKLDALLEIRDFLRYDIWDPKERAITVVNLVPQLAEVGHHQEAINLARSIELDQYRAETLVGIAPYLAESRRQEICLEAFAAALSIQDVEICIQTLLAMSPQMPESLREEALAKAIDLCWAIQNRQIRGQVLTRLVSHLAEAGYVKDALTEVQRNRSDTLVARLLVNLGPYLPESLLSEALEIVWTIKLRSNRTKALTGILPHLPPPLLEETLAAVRAIDDRSWRVQTLAGLAPWLVELGPPNDVLAAIQAVGQTDEQTQLLAQLLPKLAQRGHPHEALTAAQLIHSSGKRLQTLIDLAPHLPNKLHRQIVQAFHLAIQSLDNKVIQVDTLTELSLLLAELGYPQKALEVVEVADNAYDRASILANLAPWLGQLGYTEEALCAARATGSYGDLINLLDYLVEPQRTKVFEELLSLIQTIGDKASQIQALIDFTDWLAVSNDIEAALQVTEAIQWSSHRALVLAELAPCLSETLLTEKALPMAQAIERSEDQASALIGLLPRLAELGQPEQALQQARKISDESWQAQVLATLVLQLPESLLVEVYPTIQGIERQFWRHKVIVPFVARLAELGWIDDALDIIGDIRDTNTVAQALAQLPAPLAKSGQIEEALDWVQLVKIEHWRTQAVLALVPELLAAGHPEKAVNVVLTIRRKADRESALMQLIRQLADAGYAQEAIVATQAIEDEQQCIKVLAQIAQQFAEANNIEMALAAAQAIDSIDEQIGVLTELTPYFPDEDKKTVLYRALEMSITIESGKNRFEALSKLTPQLLTLPSDTLMHIWLNRDQDVNLLHPLAQRTRQDLLSDLFVLAPVIAKLGGPEAIGETFCTVLEVGRWWP